MESVREPAAAKTGSKKRSIKVSGFFTVIARMFVFTNLHKKTGDKYIRPNKIKILWSKMGNFPIFAAWLNTNKITIEIEIWIGWKD